MYMDMCYEIAIKFEEDVNWVYCVYEWLHKFNTNCSENKKYALIFKTSIKLHW